MTLTKDSSIDQINAVQAMNNLNAISNFRTNIFNDYQI